MDKQVIKKIITAVAERFNASESADLALILPASLQSRLEPFIGNELAKAVGNGIDARFSKLVNGGFTIGPKDGGWFVSFTDETFRELISGYLRPTTKQLLFG